jgi:hypothetical protein
VDVQVQNLGIGGWTSAEALAAFSMVGLSYNPDVVVVHCVNNDLEPMRARELAVDYSHYRRAMNVDQTDTGTATFKVNPLDAVDAYLARRLDLYVYAKLFRAETVPLRANLHGLTTWTQATRAEPSEAGIAIFERNLRSIAALAEANGAAMVLTTMPVASAASPSVGGIPDGHRRSLALQNSRLRALSEREGWVLADLALLADALEPHFEDAIHVSVAGERLKAEAIADAVEAAGLLSPKAQTESE